MAVYVIVDNIIIVRGRSRNLGRGFEKFWGDHAHFIKPHPLLLTVTLWILKK